VQQSLLGCFVLVHMVGVVCGGHYREDTMSHRSGHASRIFVSQVSVGEKMCISGVSAKRNLLS
jgi:hypothetical protein